MVMALFFLVNLIVAALRQLLSHKFYTIYSEILSTLLTECRTLTNQMNSMLKSHGKRRYSICLLIKWCRIIYKASFILNRIRCYNSSYGY